MIRLGGIKNVERTLRIGGSTLFKSKTEHSEEYEKVIFEMFYHRVYNTAYFLIQDRYLAQDIVQEIFIKAFKHIDKVQDEKTLGAWLGKIATTTSIDFLRKRKNRNDIPTEDVYLNENTKNQVFKSSPVEEIVEGRFLKVMIKQNLSKLKPDYKQVLILKYEYELKDEKISEILGISVSAVKSRLHRAKSKLRTVLGNQVEIFRDGALHET